MTNEEIRTVLTDQEHADSSRYLYYSSPARSPRSPTTPEEGGESEHEIFQDPPVDATDSADPQDDQENYTKQIATGWRHQLEQTWRPIWMLGRRASRTRWTLLACPMSMTSGVQVRLVSECPTASLSPILLTMHLRLVNASPYSQLFLRNRRCLFPARTCTSFAINFWTLISALLDPKPNLLNGMTRRKRHLSRLLIGKENCPSHMSFSQMAHRLILMTNVKGQQQSCWLSTPYMDLALVALIASQWILQPLLRDLKLLPCWEPFFGLLSLLGSTRLHRLIFALGSTAILLVLQQLEFGHRSTIWSYSPLHVPFAIGSSLDLVTRLLNGSTLKVTLVTRGMKQQTP